MTHYKLQLTAWNRATRRSLTLALPLLLLACKSTPQPSTTTNSTPTASQTTQTHPRPTLPPTRVQALPPDRWLLHPRHPRHRNRPRDRSPRLAAPRRRPHPHPRPPPHTPEARRRPQPHRLVPYLPRPQVRRRKVRRRPIPLRRQLPRRRRLHFRQPCQPHVGHRHPRPRRSPRNPSLESRYLLCSAENGQ